MQIDKNLIRNLAYQADGLNTINGGSVLPNVNVKEKEEGVSINIAIPSLSGDKFNVFVKGDHLVIYSLLENNEKQTEEDDEVMSFPLFTRTFFVPSFIDRENIDAVYKNGSLKVFMPYSEDIDQTPQKINVRYID